MSRYETEEEQIDAIKSWWKKNGTATLSAVLVVVLAASAWRYWQNTQFVNSANASATFEILQASDAQGNFGEVAREALKLMNENADSPYATAAALLHAKYSLEKSEFDEAKTHLQWAVDHAPSAELKATAQLRMARLQAQMSEFEAAKATLDSITADKGQKESALRADVDYLNGLLALSLQQTDDAFSAFQAVIDNPQTDDNLRGLAEIQLADLAK